MPAAEAANHPKESPVIRLPLSGVKVVKIGSMLGRYSAERYSTKNYRSPEQQMYLTYLIELLSSLLQEGSVKTWDFCNRIAKRSPDGILPQPDAFAWACAQAELYCSGKTKRLPDVAAVPHY